jgi:DNA polymerase-3 subunit delta
LPEWCRKWCPSRHGKEVEVRAAQLLVDLVGADMGMLDQELNKLSLYVGDAQRIENADVDRLVGNSREEETFKIFDLISAGKPPAALAYLGRLFRQGKDHMQLLGAFSSQLRRLAMTGRLVQQGVSVREAMDQAGVPGFPAARNGTEQQLRHLGPKRVSRLFDWLIQTDLGMKGSSQLPPRILLERLVIWLARPLPARR